MARFRSTMPTPVTYPSTRSPRWVCPRLLPSRLAAASMVLKFKGAKFDIQPVEKRSQMQICRFYRYAVS